MIPTKIEYINARSSQVDPGTITGFPAYFVQWIWAVEVDPSADNTTKAKMIEKYFMIHLQSMLH
jgi:hypothetical protein